MNPMTLPAPKIHAGMLTASILGLLLGTALTLGLVLATHSFQRVKTIQIAPAAPSGYQLPRTDEETYYRQLSGAQPSLAASSDLPRADEETYYRSVSTAQYSMGSRVGDAPPLNRARPSDPQ